MMHNWFETTVKFQKTLENGQIGTVSEKYLVDALTFTEAEARILEEMKPFVFGDIGVANAKRSRIAELFDNPSGDKWFRAKVMFISLDEEKGLEKKTATTMMVQGSNVKDALDLLLEKLGETLSDWEVSAIAETPIMDVYPYVAAPESPDGELE